MRFIASIRGCQPSRKKVTPYMKNRYTLIASVSAFVVVMVMTFNVTIVPEFLSVIYFSTADKKFQYVVIPQKGRGVEMMEANFTRYKDKHGISNEEYQLYRVTKKEWNRMGNWYSYLTADHWSYPYREIDID